MRDTVLRTGSSIVNKTDKGSAFLELIVVGGKARQEIAGI